MNTVYFPSCKLTAYAPDSSTKIKAYLQERFNIASAGCCRPGHKKITQEDTVVYICNTCAAIIRESSVAKNVISVWELLAADDNFPFPDYKRKNLTVQDCWRTFDNGMQQSAVRKLLNKMNLDIVELKDNFSKTKYCGVSLYQELPKQNGEFAPKRFIENSHGMFTPLTEQEQRQKMLDNCADISTDEVASYCLACVKGHEIGGKKGIHLLDLLYEKI